MRILLNAAFDTLADVGISLYIRRLVPHLAELCDLSILTPDPHLFTDYGRVVQIPECVRSTPRRTLWTLTRLAAHCRDSDVLVCATPAIPMHSRLPTVAVVHDLTPLVCRRLVPVKEKAAFWMGLQTLRLAHRVITDSSQTKVDLAKMGLLPRRRISVGYCGAGISPTTERIDYASQFMPFVLHVGSHAPHKNVARLIKAFSRVKSDPDLKLVLVGTGSTLQLDSIGQTITANGLRSRVVMLDGLSAGQMSSLYRGCRLVVCPSLYEGFGLPVLEGMAHGAPVACSAVSSLPEVAGEAATLFDPRSVADMASKMQATLDDPRAPSLAMERGTTRASLFTWERTARTIYARAFELT